ncbi:hypothetical protein BDV23DRAFT_164551 [Aspergillus alliaceus]|uniref:Uncharacterized protein n=1 Tax=Petromyces alliaceus TaxID=209559 RepID=A0A5N7BV01_PETAA|nr:hypothetical protein BDV23DRAFT_164551 [Aspergillus alliaceus]
MVTNRLASEAPPINKVGMLSGFLAASHRQVCWMINTSEHSRSVTPNNLIRNFGLEQGRTL